MTDALPDGALLLHVGPQKTGSTAIQLALHHARAELAHHGVQYVGEGSVARAAGWVALGIGPAVGRPTPQPEAWQLIADEIRESASPRLCLSNEDFARADDAAVERILAATGAERTHLVFVARRLDKLLPSHWQERVKARVTTSYADFLRQMLTPSPEGWSADLLWGPQDIGAVLDRWGRHLDRDRMVVIVSDEENRQVIPDAFESLLGLPPGLLVPPKTVANQSLDFVEAETVRRLNRLSQENDWSPEQYHQVIQRGVVTALKRHTADAPVRLRGVPDWALSAVADRADAQIEAITSAGVRVIGDTETLRVRDRVQPAELPDVVERVPLDVLSEVVNGAVAGADRLEARSNPAPSLGASADLSGRELLRLLGQRVKRRTTNRR